MFLMHWSFYLQFLRVKRLVLKTHIGNCVLLSFDKLNVLFRFCFQQIADELDIVTRCKISALKQVKVDSDVFLLLLIQVNFFLWLAEHTKPRSIVKLVSRVFQNITSITGPCICCYCS